MQVNAEDSPPDILCHMIKSPDDWLWEWVKSINFCKMTSDSVIGKARGHAP